MSNKSELTTIEEAEEGENFLTSTKFSDALDVAVSTSSRLVFEADEKGDKEAKEAATSINLYAKNAKKQINDEFNNQTSTLSGYKKELLEKVGKLLTIRQSIIDQSAERREAKLKEIKKLLILELAYAWNNSGVRREHQGDLTAVDKAVMLSSLTAKGVLTKKAKDYIQAVCDKNLSKQSLFDFRILSLKNKCLEAGVESSALNKEYVGIAFFGTDEEFNVRVDSLLTIEIDKKLDLERKIEVDRQKAVDDALEKQKTSFENDAGAGRGITSAVEKVQLVVDGEKLPDNSVESLFKEEIEDQKFSGVSGKGEIITEDELEKEVIQNGKKKMEIVVNLSVIVPDRMTNEFIQDKVEYELSELLSEWLDSVYVREANNEG